MNQILWVGKSYTMPGAGVKPHSHPYYHMLFVLSGVCRFHVEGVQYDVQPGQCLLVPPQMQHAYTNEGSEPMDYYELKFSLLQSGQNKLLCNGVAHMESRLIGLLLEQIQSEYARLGSVADDAAAAFLNAILHVLTQPQRVAKPRRFRYFDASGTAELSQRIVAHLEKHYKEDLSLDDLAAAMDYNKSYLCVAFKKDVGMTILDCLNTIRIRRAAELIVYSDHPMAQVAELCGFASVSHFNRVFLKYVGTTPGQCRRAFPVDALFGDRALPDRPNPFMYSALAQKQITVEMIDKMANFQEEQ